jgi:16S rRNA (cytidine1402-2'-O)-methyltransferase
MRRFPEIVHTKHVPSEYSVNKGTLYIVSTPIGNPEDITLRAIRVMRSVSILAAEDGRMIRTLLAHNGIDTQLCSLRPHRGQIETLDRLKSALSVGEDVGLVCDAGTPLIADPGALIVKAAIAMQCRVVPIPGPVAGIAGLTVSGLNTQRFSFDGFPPRAKSDRAKFFSSLAAETRTIILYETRSFLPNTLRTLANCLGESRKIAVMRDLTRSSETIYRGSVAEIAEQFGDAAPRGEYVLVIAGLTAD